MSDEQIELQIVTTGNEVIDHILYEQREFFKSTFDKLEELSGNEGWYAAEVME